MLSSVSTTIRKEVIARRLSVFSQVTSDRTPRHGLKLHQGRLILDIRKNFFTDTMVKHWNRLPKKVMEFPSLEVLKGHLKFSDGTWSVRLMVVSDDLGGLCHPR